MNNQKNIFTYAIVIFLCVISANIVNAQINITTTAAVTQNFDGMSATTTLPANWRVAAQNASPTWSAGATTVGIQASSGTPATGGTYNWGTSSSERAVGAMTSGGFNSPNNFMAEYVNSNSNAITQLTISYTGERYRRNSAAASIQFFYSLNGTTWTAVTAGNIAAASFPTGASAYNFPSPLIVNVSAFNIASLNIANGAKFYLRWNLNTTGSNSQGIGIDNVSVTAAFASPPSVPVLSNGSTSGSVGTAFTTFNLSTLATNSPTSYAIVSGLPPGLSLNTSTGAITGTPTTAGTYSTVFNATNGSGTSTSNATLTITIAKGNQTITFNPLGSVVYGTVPGNLTATSTSGLTVSFTSATPSVAALSGTNNATITYGAVGSSNITASQAGDANWNAATAVVRAQSVTQKVLTVTGLTGVNKQYDGTTAATATGTPALNGVLAGDVGNVTITGTPTFTFNTAAVGIAKPITTSGYTLTGSASGNYSLTQPTLSANVTVKTITLTGATANNKVYDTNTSATITSGTLNGVVAADVANVSATTGTFASANVGTNIAVTVLLTGSAAGNYILTQPGLTANITKANQTITFGTLADRFTGGANFALTATASSGLAVSYTSSNTAVATVAGSTVTIVGAGSTIITASQTGNSNYFAAADVQQTQLIIDAPVTMATYLFTGWSSSPSVGSLSPSGVVSNVTFSNISYNNITPNGNYPSGNAFGGSGSWGTALSATRYIQFTVTAASGYLLNLYSFDMEAWRSAAGATNYAIRSSLDGYGSNLASGSVGTTAQTSVSTLTLPSGFTGISTVTFRIYGYGGNSTGDWRLDNFAIDGSVTSSCTTPTALAFQTQPVTSNQDVAIPIVVKATCSGGATATSLNTGSVTLTTTGCGMQQSGSSVQSITANFVNGVATFNNITFSRSTQTNINFTTTNTQGLTNVTSNNFTINAPSGSSPTNTTIASENFESTTSWNYTIGTPTYSGSGGGGVDVTGIKTISSNKSLCKSYSQSNAADERKSTTTVTFANQTIAASYEYSTFSFQLGSISTGGTGAGVDNGDNCTIQISLDNGSTWSTLLTYNGNSDYEFPFSASPVTSLAYNSNATYNKPSTKSAFSVQLPVGTTQFRFRMTATSNRTNENWALDNVLLVGTDIPSGNPSPLPTATGGTVATCPNTDNTLTVLTTNTVGAVTYSWNPTTNMTPSAGNIANPIVNPAVGTVYTVTITDADYCTATATQTISVPSGTDGVWTGAETNDWFYCRNWGNGVVPTSATNVTIPNGVANIATIDPLSTYSTPVSGIAYANNITINASAQLVGIDNAELRVSGNWDNDGSFTPGISTVTFTGSGTSTIDGLTAQQFNILTIDKQVQLLVDASTNGTGILAVNNTLDLNGNVFTVNNPDAASITRTAPGYIKSETQNGSARLLWQMDDYSYSDNYVFPMGSNSSYLPVTFKLNNGNLGLAGVATYNSANAAAWPTGTENVLDVNNPATAVQRFWHLESDQPANNYNADVTFSFPGGEDPTAGLGVNVKFQRYNKPTDTWDLPLSTQTYTLAATRTVQVQGVTKFSWWGGGNDDNTNPLPIELIGFKANCNENATIIVNWATATETNNDYFTIERSVDLISFEKVGVISGADNSNTLHNYSFTDENPINGTSYYRLVQTDYNGEFETFAPVAINCFDRTTNSINVYPNPANNSLQIALSIGNKDIGTLNLYNNLGQKIISHSIEPAAGLNTYNVDLSSLPDGQYFIMINMGNSVLPTQKLIVSHN